MRCRRYDHRRLSVTVLQGSVLFESLMAIAIVGMMAVFVSQLIVAASRQSLAVERRQAASQMVANVMERAMRWTWDEANANAAAALAKSFEPELSPIFSNAELKIVVEDIPTETVPGKHIRVELSYADASGLRHAPAVLSAFKFPDEKGAP